MQCCIVKEQLHFVDILKNNFLNIFTAWFADEQSFKFCRSILGEGGTQSVLFIIYHFITKF